MEHLFQIKFDQYSEQDFVLFSRIPNNMERLQISYSITMKIYLGAPNILVNAERELAGLKAELVTAGKDPTLIELQMKLSEVAPATVEYE